jgi:transposase
LSKLPEGKERIPVPAIQSYFIEPIFEQFCALLPEREVNHPLGCHRPRIPDRVVFEKLLQVLVFGCAYWRIADESCSETTLRRRRDEWIDLGVMDALREMVLEAYERLIGLELADVAVDGCITKELLAAASSRVGIRWIGANRAPNARRQWMREASP